MSKGSLRYQSPEDMPIGMRRLVEAQSATAKHSGAPTPMQQLSKAEAVKGGPFVQKTRHVKHETGVMNKTEARYAQFLDARKADGSVTWWGFEVVKLRLAKRTWLTVDFLVQVADGSFELHEVKGRKGNRYFATEDGKLKAKFAAEQFPFWPFRIVWPAKAGGWDQELQG